MRLRFSGFGGQGVVLCGFVFGKAAMLEGSNSMQTQSYGSASRGGLTRSDVVIQEGEIHDLTYDRLDVLVALSQQSYDKYLPELDDGGLLFYESTLVRDVDVPAAHGLDATDIAYKQFGHRIMANMIMMGFVNEIASAVSNETLTRTVRESVPPGTEDKNIAAFEEGRRLAREQTG